MCEEIPRRHLGWEWQKPPRRTASLSTVLRASLPPLFLLCLGAAAGFPSRPDLPPSGRRRRRRADEGADDNIFLEEGGARQARWNASVKDLKICSVLGGLDLTRLRSFTTRSIFRGAIEDVELMREHWTESMYNDGLRGGMSDLDAMAATLDWRARNDWAAETKASGWTNLTANDTTLTAGLGWADDRADRRIERHIPTPNQPFVGTKQTDMSIMDTASNIMPWLLDRRSREVLWFASHQNGQSEGPTKEPLLFDYLYIAVWGMTWGNTGIYFPPMSAFRHPNTFGDILGGEFNYRKIPAFPPGWPFDHDTRGGTVKDAMYGHPYADVGHPGLSMISALAPVYYTGEWRGYEYKETYVGSAGLDITLDAIAGVLDDLEDGLCRGSFALLADADTFDVIALSQSVVKKIYPARTGMEEKRVTRTQVDGSIVDDRRNQTYLVSDTIWQSLLQGLDSANWTMLHGAVQGTPRGERGYITLDMTLTGESESREYYILFDRWASVSEWVVLVFAPVDEVEGAIRPVFLTEEEMDPHPVDVADENSHSVYRTMEVHLNIVQGGVGMGWAMLLNNGTLDIVARPSKGERRMPDWMRLADAETWDEGVKLKPGQGVTVEFVVDTRSGLLGLGATTAPLSFDVHDDDYPDCLYSSPIALQVSVRVSPEPNLHQLGKVRVGGLVMCAVVLASAVAFVFWVWWFRNDRVVRASQPFFLHMICFGCFVMGCTIIPLSVDDGNATTRECNIACMAAPWLFSMGFVITFAALFSKIWRINKIFHQSNFKRITVTERDVIIPFAALFFLNFAFLLCWTLVDPLVWKRVPLGEWESFGTCTAEGKAHIAFAALIGATDLAALVLACIQAYQAREIGDEFSESKFIGIALGSMLQVSLLGIPLMFLVTDNPTATFYIKSTLVFIISMTVLLLIFVPKMVYVKNAKKRLIAKNAAALARTMQHANDGVNTTQQNATFVGTTTNIKGTESEETSHSVQERSDANAPGLRITQFGSSRKAFGESILRARLEERVEMLETILFQHGIDYERIMEEIDGKDGVGDHSARILQTEKGGDGGGMREPGDENRDENSLPTDENFAHEAKKNQPLSKIEEITEISLDMDDSVNESYAGCEQRKNSDGEGDNILAMRSVEDR